MSDPVYFIPGKDGPKAMPDKTIEHSMSGGYQVPSELSPDTKMKYVYQTKQIKILFWLIKPSRIYFSDIAPVQRHPKKGFRFVCNLAQEWAEILRGAKP